MAGDEVKRGLRGWDEKGKGDGMKRVKVLRGSDEKGQRDG